jgi:hypothetical protein
MNENPYQAPLTPVRVLGVKSGSREDLRSVGAYQKGIIVCILIYLIAVLVQFALPQSLRLFLGLGFLALGVISTVFVFLLSIKVYSVGLGILYGFLTLVPCIGLIMLLVINAKATTILRQNGIRVGLLGANLSDI